MLTSEDRNRRVSPQPPPCQVRVADSNCAIGSKLRLTPRIVPSGPEESCSDGMTYVGVSCDSLTEASIGPVYTSWTILSGSSR